ncbi:MAG TPA: hypothetical protein DCZ01_10130 [Elusimicrobia bacterium]|nr:MAG: hypothetical protein A2X37_07175 [Elusimicrobia bacterium GWA2_66_18]OGR70887.1 MAG: hypothetical protein A2X40_04955 [Elusimicrobia bacterium GWC2_65_9]HAZ08856.1 hypothetical protein [Elusimicrobiota bacterium]
MNHWTQRRRLLAGLVAALSLLVHLKGIRAPLLDYHFHRQVNTASIARNYWREARPIHRPRVDWEGPEDRMAATELPVQTWLYGKLWPLFGLGESWGRILSTAASALTAFFLFLLFERELGTESAFYGAALFCLLPVEIYFGRTVQPEACALLGVVSALYFWERALAPGRPLWPWAISVFSAFVAVGLKLPYAYVLIPLAALTWRRLGRGTLLDARLWLAGLLAMGGVFAWYRYAGAGVYVVPTHSGEFWRILGYRRTLYFAQFLVFSRFLEIIATYGGTVLFFFGARELLWRRRDAFWLAWLGGVFFHLLALGEYGHSHDYTCLPLAPVAAGLMGVGLRLLMERARAAISPSWALSGVFLLVASIPAHAALRIAHWYRQGFDYLSRAGEAAAAVSRPGDLFFTSCMAPSVALYYLDRRGWSDDLASQLPANALAAIAQKRLAGARFLAVEKKGAWAQPDGALWKDLRSRSQPVWDDGRLAIFRL